MSPKFVRVADYCALLRTRRRTEEKHIGKSLVSSVNKAISTVQETVWSICKEKCKIKRKKAARISRLGAGANHLR